MESESMINSFENDIFPYKSLLISCLRYFAYRLYVIKYYRYKINKNSGKTILMKHVNAHMMLTVQCRHH